jgi:hypothetical protein
MIYIFFSNNKWFLHQGDLPVKPKQKEEYSYCNPSLIELENLIWDKAIADIKAKALEIANQEIITTDEVPGTPGEPYKKGEFYQWPGTFETKWQYKADQRSEWENCHVSVFQVFKEKKNRARRVAHLVLPPEE